MDPISPKPIYGIGIDTGGTYTDAVLVKLRDRAVIKSKKRPTVHHDLRQGIIAALDDLLCDCNAEQIGIIAFSTTLATNAIVEGQGADVGLIVIGPVKAFEAPVVSVRYAEGGHDQLGREAKPLAIDQVVDAVIGMRGHVDAYAIAAAMSIENPTHEQVAAKAVELTDPKPVFCSHDISHRSGIRERAATAVFHARLAPVIQRFVDQVEQLAQSRHFAANMKMIHGDATAVSLAQASAQAACSVASGPAATAFFGAQATTARTALVVDVGGTTTDITLIKDRKPSISRDGSRIDRWRTHVDAVDMHTVGIGGDSLVVVDRFGKIAVGPRRVQPLAMTVDSPDPEKWIGAGNRNRWILASRNQQDRIASEDPILAYLAQCGGATPATLMEALGMSDLGLDRSLEKLGFRRQVKEIGFTPTDALHVLGRLNIGDARRSLSGAAALAAVQGESVETFCRQVIDRAQQKIIDAIVGYAYHQQTGRQMEALTADAGSDALLSFSFKLNTPIIGIGAAAGELLPEVARRLGTQLILPSHYEVGNALGAILIALQPQMAPSKEK